MFKFKKILDKFKKNPTKEENKRYKKEDKEPGGILARPANPGYRNSNEDENLFRNPIFHYTSFLPMPDTSSHYSDSNNDNSSSCSDSSSSFDSGSSSSCD